MHLFRTREQNFASFDTLNGQFLKFFVLTLIGGSGTFFFKDKRSNKVETVQHFKICFLMNKSENFKAEPKSSEAQKIPKSLYATGHMRQYGTYPGTVSFFS
jgi:hypothetical protein